MKLMNLLLTVVVTFLGATAQTWACNFCLQAQGVNPYLTNNGSGISLSSTYIESKQIYDGSKKVDSKGKKEGWLLYNLTAFMPVGEKFSLELQVPYAIKTNVDLDDGTNLNTGTLTTGVGDISLLGRYTFLKQHTLDSTFLGGFQLGIKLPTASTNLRNNAGNPVDRHALPGTGSTDYIVGLTSSYVLAQGSPENGSLWAN